MTTKADIRNTISTLIEQIADVSDPGREHLALVDAQGQIAQRFVAVVTRRIKAAEKKGRKE